MYPPTGLRFPQTIALLFGRKLYKAELNSCFL